MGLNIGYAGLGKEATPGTAVPPTLFLRVPEVPQVRAAVRMVEIPALDALGAPSIIPVARSGEADLSVVVTPKAIGALLAGLLGAPATTGTAPDYTHVFTPQTSFPSYTLEVQDGVAVHRLTGAQVTELTFSHGADGYLQARARLVAMDRTTTGTPATPTFDDQYFIPGQVTISVGGSPVTARATSVEITISVPKTPFNSLAQIPASAVYPEGTADVTANIELIFDSTADANSFSDFLTGTSRAISIAWTISANTSLAIDFDAVIVEDPFTVANRDAGMARVRRALRAVRTGTSLLTVTLKNQHASY